MNLMRIALSALSNPVLILWLYVSRALPFKDESQAALFKDPVRTAL